MDAATRDMLSQVAAMGFNVLLTLLLALGGWALKALKDKFQVETTAAQQETLRKVADQAIYFAEEWSARQKAPLGGEEKRQLALGYAKKVLPAIVKTNAGVVAMDRYVHAALGARKGFGASKDVGADMLQ